MTKHGLCEQAVYAWRKNYGALEAADVKQLRSLQGFPELRHAARTPADPSPRARPPCLQVLCEANASPGALRGRRSSHSLLGLPLSCRSASTRPSDRLNDWLLGEQELIHELQGGCRALGRQVRHDHRVVRPDGIRLLRGHEGVDATAVPAYFERRHGFDGALEQDQVRRPIVRRQAVDRVLLVDLFRGQRPALGHAGQAGLDDQVGDRRRRTRLHH